MSQDIQRIKQQVDIQDVAHRLGLEQPDGRGNWRSPHHEDKNPSLAIYPDGRWNDFSQDDAHGDVIDLVEFVRRCDTRDALDWLRHEYGIERPKANGNGVRGWPGYLLRHPDRSRS